MPLSEEHRRRIEEEEYRKTARERLERTVRLEADIRSSSADRLEVRGVSTEIYRDGKNLIRSFNSKLANAIAWLANAVAWLAMLVSGAALLGVSIGLVLIVLGVGVQGGQSKFELFLGTLALGLFYFLPGAIAFTLKMRRRNGKVK